jgi:hypothetical protein
VFGGDVGVIGSDFAAAGGMSATDEAFVNGGGDVPPPPVDTTPTEEITVSGSRSAPVYSLPVDVVAAVTINASIADAVGRVYEATTTLGATAAGAYAERQEETGNPLYAIPGSLAALWTPETAPETLLVLGSASGLGRWSGRPFWQYFPAENPGYRSTWLTRGAGWTPPYEVGGEAAANLALPGYNPGTSVRAVHPKWNQYVRGPRVVDPQPQFGPGAVGGGREYRVMPFEP